MTSKEVDSFYDRLRISGCWASAVELLYNSDPVKKDETGGACSMYRDDERRDDFDGETERNSKGGRVLWINLAQDKDEIGGACSMYRG